MAQSTSASVSPRPLKAPLVTLRMALVASTDEAPAPKRGRHFFE